MAATNRKLFHPENVFKTNHFDNLAGFDDTGLLDVAVEIGLVTVSA